MIELEDSLSFLMWQKPEGFVAKHQSPDTA